jgi:hypothetical protein
MILLEYLYPPEAHKTAQRPQPLPLNRPHASFLEDFVGQLPSSPAPKRYCPEAVDSLVTRWVEAS